ncbi:MAG: GNAT family N-acetyltransferase [Candidatus Dormibacteria bacterium]
MTALATPSRLRDGEVSLLPVDATVAALLVAASHDRDITRWTQVPKGMRMLDAGLVVAGWAGTGNVVRLQVRVGDGEPVGMVTVWINSGGEAEVGYWLLKAARGRGVARRAVRLLCEWAFTACEVDLLRLTTLLGNTSSEKVAASCGFRPAGTRVGDVRGSRQVVRSWVRARDSAIDSADQREAMGT